MTYSWKKIKLKKMKKKLDFNNNLFVYLGI